MISLYSGTPGSGKSLHVAREIVGKLKLGKNVIANFPIDTDKIKKRKKKSLGQFIYKDNSELNVKDLVEYAKKHHKIGKEGQTLLVIDECQVHFNPREFSKSDRLEWNNFFSQHRKLGFNVILVTQNDRLIDRQIRALIEYNCIHRKVNNFGFVGMLFPMSVFVSVTYWYGLRERLDSEFFTYKKVYGELYNTYAMFQ